MPAWIECPECREEFRDKPGRTKCPECGARVEPEDDFDDEPIRRRRTAKPKSRALLFSLIGVGVLAVAFVAIVVILLVGGSKADPSKVTVVNFQKLNAGMTQKEAEKILAGSSSSSVQDMKGELSRAFGFAQAEMEALFTMFSGNGTWRRWDGPGSNLKVWGLFVESLGGGERLSFSLALEKLPNGGYIRHQGQQTLGGIFGGFPGFPAGQPFPQMPPPQFPQFPQFPK